jgi:hypothetical protein
VACALNEDSADCSNLIVFTFSAAIQRSGTIEYTWHPDGRLPARGVQEETASTTSPYWRVQRSGARDIRREPLTVTRSPTESNVNVHKRALLAVIGLAGDVGAGPPTGVPCRHGWSSQARCRTRCSDGQYGAEEGDRFVEVRDGGGADVACVGQPVLHLRHGR